MNNKQKLKRELSNYLRLKNTVLFSSCRNALHTLLLSLNLDGGEVIVQNFICDSLPWAINDAGGKVVLVDVNVKTFNLDVKEVEKKINPNTKAILFVHTYGNPEGIVEIARLCKENNLILIEDIAHGLGSTNNGQLAGTFGDYAVYSFTKQLVNFGGGALISNNDLSLVRSLRDKLHRKVPLLGYLKRLLASLYETRAFFVSKILIDIARKKADLKMVNSLDKNFKCSNFEAWMVLRQLSGLKRNILKRRRNYNFLLCNVKTQLINTGSACNYLSLVFLSEKMRDKAVKKSFYFLPPWIGSKVSSKVVFIPNNPNFSKRKLNRFIRVYKALY